jgi:hypothetical protein
LNDGIIAAAISEAVKAASLAATKADRQHRSLVFLAQDDSSPVSKQRAHNKLKEWAFGLDD